MKNQMSITTTTKGLKTELKKRSMIYFLIYMLFVGILSVMLFFNYFSVFTSNFYPKSFSGDYMVGVAHTSNYHNTPDGSLLYVKSYVNYKAIQVGDEIFYAGNIGEGSGVVDSLSSDYLTIQTNGKTINIQYSTVFGKVAKKVAGWGYVLWFFQSWTGVIVLTLLMVLVVISRMFFIYNVETSAKGRELQQKLIAQKKAYKKLKKMYQNYKDTGLDIDSLELLAEDYEQNKQALLNYSKNRDLPNAYKFLLTKVHRVYLTKDKLTALDKEKITNCIELMCLAEKFDMDIEYMLTDLILRSNVSKFQTEEFIIACKQYLSKKHTMEDLACFESVLYVLIKENKILQTEKFVEVLDLLETNLTKSNNDKNAKHLLNLSNYIKILIKN